MTNPKQTRRVFVDAGHHDITLPELATRVGEPIEGPNGPLVALTTPGSFETFQRGVQELVALREQDVEAVLGVFIGDLAVPSADRPDSSECLAPSYLAELAARGLNAADVEWVSEATARNRGKKLIDRMRHRYPGSEETYADDGWAFCTDGEVMAIVSDRTLEGTEGTQIAVLTRGKRALCPAILIGHKHLLGRSGHTEHLAIYSKVDDPHIGGKLWAASLAVEALSPDTSPLEVHDHVLQVGEGIIGRSWRAERGELVGPGELDLDDLVGDLQQAHPEFELVA